MNNKKMMELAKKAFLEALKIKKFPDFDNAELAAQINGERSIECRATKTDGTEITGTISVKQHHYEIYLEWIIEPGVNKPRYLFNYVTLPLENI